MHELAVCIFNTCVMVELSMSTFLQTGVAGNSQVWWKHAGSNVRRECRLISRRQVQYCCLLWTACTLLAYVVLTVNSAPSLDHCAAQHVTC